eukprot:Skav210960  [mRNA]  locus=scaffold2798:39502:40845:+ [translate_table: standard]
MSIWSDCSSFRPKHSTIAIDTSVLTLTCAMALLFVKDGENVKPVVVSSGSVVLTDHLTTCPRASSDEITETMMTMKKDAIVDAMATLGLKFNIKSMPKPSMVRLINDKLDMLCAQALSKASKASASSASGYVADEPSDEEDKQGSKSEGEQSKSETSSDEDGATDFLFNMEGKSADYDGMVIGNPDGNCELKLEVPTATNAFTVIFKYQRNKATGADLFEALATTFGVNAGCFNIQFYHTASILREFDGIDAYNRDDIIFKLVLKTKGGAKRSVMSSITKKASKPQLYREKADETFGALSGKTYGCDPLKDAQAINKFINENLSSGFQIFSSAVEHLDEARATEALKVLQSKTQGYGTTELKVEKVCEIALTGILGKLSAHQQEITELRNGILCGMVSAYTTWTFTKGKFNNGILTKMLEDRIEAIKKNGADVDMEALGKMLEGTRL